MASELKADMILLDEKEGRSAAKRINLKPVGVIGILLEAKSKHFIKDIKPHLDSLIQVAGFHLSDPLYRHSLDLANEKFE